MKPSLPKTKNFLDYEKSLACIHCGLCLSSCPTYLETGNENDSPRGRIYLMRAVEEGRLPLSEIAVKHLDLCLGCRACEAVCPSGVQYGELLEATRAYIGTNYRRSILQTFLRRIAIEQVFPFPSRMKLALWPAKILKRLSPPALLPNSLREALSLIPEDSSASSMPEVSRTTIEPRLARVGFIRGCVMSVMFGPTNRASVSALNRLGYDVLTPAAQVCCGALYAHGGNLEKARACARHNIRVFERLDLDAIIINAAGCGSTLKEYHQLLHNDPEWRARAKAFSEKVKDLTEWLALSKSIFALLSESAVRNRPAETKVTYHDACHLAHPQRITRAPRDLVRAAVGEMFVELQESDVCCGSAGSYNLTEPEMAERLRHRKIENVLRSGAQLVITTNPGCILQIRAGLKKAGADHIRVLHMADFLEDRLNQIPE